MSADKQKVFNILEMRFDYQSSRNVFYNWRKSVGIREEPETLNDEDLKSLLGYLKENAAGADRVHAAIERLILATDDTPAAEVAVEAPVEEAHVEEAHFEAPAEEAYVEAPAEEYVEAPAEEYVEAPAEEAPAEEAAGDDAAADEAASDEAKAEDNHSEGGKKKKKSKR